MSTHSQPSTHTPADTSLKKTYSPAVEDFRAQYPFELDQFQLDAAEAIAHGRGVLVGAPTGAGKTVVGEFAVYTAFHNDGTCFYTTPIKALSNQKYHDLVARYGEDNVGLLTGDSTVNAAAPIVVMTTEVLRNMIYADSERLRTLTHVVMDEVHFLSDPSRGPVWEEAILNLDTRVILVSLSATVSNMDEFGGWLSTVRGDTDIIATSRRPVALHQLMMVGNQILPLFDTHSPDTTHNAGGVNRAVVAAVARQEEMGRRRGPRRCDVVTRMGEAKMLPAIYFIFSRAGCEGAVQQLLVDRVDFTHPKEREEILRTIDAAVVGLTPEDLNVLGFKRFRRALSRGFSCHHAGMLPAFRHIVEDLFSRGLLKVCFATETLALGINMPARSVVLEKLIKFNGESHVDLTPGQYTQLTGRAGRRGIDTVGNAVVLYSQGIDPYAVAALASTKQYPLNSTFRPGYNMAINMLATQGWEEAHRLLERSFAQYQANGTVVQRATAIEKRRKELAQQSRSLEDILRAEQSLKPADIEHNTDLALDYAQLRRQLAQEQRRAKKEASSNRQLETAAILRSLATGDVIALPTGRNPMTAVVVRPDTTPKHPQPLVITDEGWLERINPGMFANTPVLIGHMHLHKGVTRSPKRLARSVAAHLRRTHFRDQPEKLKPRAGGSSAQVVALRQAIQDHPVHRWHGREEIAQQAVLLLKARRRLAFEEGTDNGGADSLAGQFDRIVALLQELDYVDINTSDEGVTHADITIEGQRLSRIHHESDLLVAQCLRRGIWDELDPAELAAVASVVVFENRREAAEPLDMPTQALATAIEHTVRIYTQLSTDEQRHGIAVTRAPELGFALALHQWTSGAPLDYCLRAAEASGAALTPGDFVRWCRRVMDILDQIRTTAYSDSVKSSSRHAVRAINRSVVALED